MKEIIGDPDRLPAKQLWEKYFDRIKQMRNEAFSDGRQFDWEALTWGLSHIGCNINRLLNSDIPGKFPESG
jgi:hypothetical protein